MNFPVVDKIYNGYTITNIETGDAYLVIGQMTIRKKTSYIVRCPDGSKGSMSREMIMTEQATGNVKVTLEDGRTLW